MDSCIVAWTRAGRIFRARAGKRFGAFVVKIIPSNFFCGGAVCWQHVDFRSWSGDHRQADVLHYRTCHSWHFRVVSIVFAGIKKPLLWWSFLIPIVQKACSSGLSASRSAVKLASAGRAAFPCTSTLDNSSAFKVIMAFILETHLIIWIQVFLMLLCS